MKKLETITAIIGLVVVECMALHHGMNGTMFSLVIAGIAGLGGYSLKAANGLKSENVSTKEQKYR